MHDVKAGKVNFLCVVNFKDYRLSLMCKIFIEDWSFSRPVIQAVKSLKINLEKEKVC